MSALFCPEMLKEIVRLHFSLVGSWPENVPTKETYKDNCVLLNMSHENNMSFTFDLLEITSSL